MSERNRLQTYIKNASLGRLIEMAPKIVRHDRGRLKAMKNAVKEGHNAGHHSDVIKIVKRIWWWNLFNMPGLLWRRFKTQRLRTVDQSVIDELLIEGINEGGHQGDVDHFHDRFSASPQTAIRQRAPFQCLAWKRRRSRASMRSIDSYSP